jgi:hypothetical protein
MANIAPKGEKTLESDQLSCGGRHRCFILLLSKTRKHLSFLDFNLSMKLAVHFSCHNNGWNFSTWCARQLLYMTKYLVTVCVVVFDSFHVSSSRIVSYVVCMGFLQSPPKARLWAGLQSEWSLQLARYNPRLQWACQMCFVWHYPTKVVRMECASITGNSHVFKVFCTLEDLLFLRCHWDEGYCQSYLVSIARGFFHIILHGCKLLFVGCMILEHWYQMLMQIEHLDAQGKLHAY